MGHPQVPAGSVYTPERMGHQGIYIGQQYLALEIFENKRCHHLQAVRKRFQVKIISQKQECYWFKKKNHAIPGKLEIEAYCQYIHTLHWAQT